MRTKFLVGGVSFPALVLFLSSVGLSAEPGADVRDRAYDWSGLYAGGFIGYADVSSNGFFATSLDLTFGGGGIFAGGRVGWNWQHNELVIGIEHDAAWMEWGATNLREEQYITNGDFLSTARVRVGWADDNVLFFLTGGAAYLHANVETSLGGGDPDQKDNEDYKDVSAVGGVVGAGIEWGLSRNVSVTAEGQYVFFGARSDLSGLEEGLGAGGIEPGVPDGVPANHFGIDDGFLFKLGVNWRLWNPNGNGGGAGAREDYATLWDGPYEWGGFYAGTHVGIGKLDPEGVYDNERMTDPALPLLPQPAPILLDGFNSMGLLGGFQAGYNVQMGRMVAGIEADVSGADWDDLFTDLQLPSSPQAEQLNIGLLGTVRGRAGFAYHNLFMYGTAGLAYLKGEYNDITFDVAKDLSSFGAVYGAGVEWGFSPELSIKAEALQFHFNDEYDLEDMSGVAGDYLKLTDSLQFRLGANWHFGPRNIDADALAALRADDYDWTGIYGGVHLGYGGLVTEGVYNTDPLPNQAVDLTTISKPGLVAGGQAGLNWQSGALVLGIEGDLSHVDWSGREGVFYSPDEYVQFNSNWLTTLRGRVGYADDNLLFYITGGLAWLKAEIDNTANLGGSYIVGPGIPPPPPTYTPNPADPGKKRNINALGGVAGLGMEWGITKNLSAKVEGQYIFFNDVHNIQGLGSEGDPGDFFQLDDGFVFNFGVNYRFNPFYLTADYVRHKTFGPDILAEHPVLQAGEGDSEPEGNGGDEAERLGWSFSSTLNRATVVWNDGDQTGLNSVDNPQDSTAIEATYRHALGNGWSAALTATVDAYYVGGDSVDQLNWEGTGAIAALPYLFGAIENETWGRIIVGMSDSASDEIDNINLAGADVVSDASFDNFAAGYYLRAKDMPGAGGLASGMANALDGELRWGDILDGKFAGDSGRFITYVSPDWKGLEASAAVGLPTEIFFNYTDEFLYTERTNGVFWDVALRYADKIGSDFLVEGGIGYWNDTTEEKLAVEPTEDQGVGGSLALRHVPTGLNFAVNFGAEEHTDNCAEQGALSGKCRGTDSFLNFKGGIVRDIVSFGRTSFYGEFYKNWKNPHDSDEDLMATLYDITYPDPSADPLPVVEGELLSTEVTGFGFGVVQRVEKIDADFYLGFRYYRAELESEIGAVDPLVEFTKREFEDFLTVTAGVTVQFGDLFGDPDQMNLNNKRKNFGRNVQ